MKYLNNKVVIVTGGAASIGKEISQSLSDAGATVVIASRDSNQGEEAARKIGNNTLYIQTDITNDSDLKNLVDDTVKEFGGLDILVNNACSYGDDGQNTSRDVWLQTLNTNVVSAALLGEISRPYLAKNKGNIVNIGSVSGSTPHVGRWAYPVAKSALKHLSMSQALDYAKDGIRVNLLRLGHIWSAPFAGLTGDDRSHADKVSSPYNLMGRVADAREVGNTVVFISSNQASYITGTEIVVDGGYSVLGAERQDPLMSLLQKK